MKKYLIVCGCLAGSLLFCVDSEAQSIRNISKVVNTVAGHFRSLDITGTWDYTGSSVSFESDNLLKKAGGTLAASQIENKIDDQLSKVGFREGVTSFTFNDDGTFTNNMVGRNVSGTYELDREAGYLTLKYLNHVPMKAKLTGSSDKLSLLFESGGFLSLVSFLGSHSGSSILGGVSSIANSYDGMLMGIELRRQ